MHIHVCTDVSVFCFSGYTHFLYAACPGGEGAVLKIVGLNRLAGSNPVRSALCPWCNGSTPDSDSGEEGSIPSGRVNLMWLSWKSIRLIRGRAVVQIHSSGSFAAL